jgi:hypothetical protein
VGMYCSCSEPDVAEGYSVTNVGVLNSVGYCCTCSKPVIESEIVDRDRMNYSQVMSNPVFSYILDSKLRMVESTPFLNPEGIHYRWERELSMNEIEEGIDRMLRHNTVVARRQWTGAWYKDGRRIYVGDIFEVKGHQGVMLTYHVGGLNDYDRLRDWGDWDGEAVHVGNEYMNPELMKTVIRSIGGA